MRTRIINKLIQYAQKDPRVFLVTGDAGYGVLDEYQRRFPHRFLNLGVAEQNMMSFSAGLALAGYKVFLYNIIPFLLYRAYEQLRDDICYQRLAVTLIGIGSGFTYAPQGMTHYSLEDISLALTIPNLVILSPSDPYEAEGCMRFAFKSNKPVYIRIAKSAEPLIHTRPVADVRLSLVVKKGRDVAVLFHGSIASEVMDACQDLEYEPTLISMPMLRPVNFLALKRQLRGIHTIITVEEHFVQGGLGSILEEWIIRKNLPFQLKKLGVKNEFVHRINNTAGMRQAYGICQRHIREAIIKAFLKKDV